MTPTITRAEARWPEAGDPAAPPPLAGFVVSSFSPLVAAVAERCLIRGYGDRTAAPARTAIVIVSPLGDVASAVHVAEAVDHRTRVGPLLFYQSVPNAVAGYVAARWGLAGPVVCTSPVGDELADGLAMAGLLLDDGDCDEALVVVVTGTARALLVSSTTQEAS
jgi:3-oxoacyl-(acyl-carrier-protein) synthase